MNSLRIRVALTAVIAAILAAGLMAGCSTKSPDRNQIPVLRKRLFALQQAVQEQNRAALDSLLSVQILARKQSSDSLLNFVYGADGAFAFRQFELGEIIYTDNKARIDCYVMDTTGRRDRPIVLTLVNEHDMWLLKHFEEAPPDTVETDI